MMKSILIFALTPQDRGITKCIIDLHKNLSKEQYKISCVSRSYNTQLKELSEQFNGEFYALDTVYFKAPIKYISRIKEIFVKDFDITVFHIPYLSNLYELNIASKHCKKVVIHSHNSFIDSQKLSTRVIVSFNHFRCRVFVNKYITNQASCSRKAAEWMFGPNNINPDIIYYNNSAHIECFKFSASTRDKLRVSYNISENEKLIGTIGQMSFQKNQVFLLEVFKIACDINPNIKLWIIGDGPMKNILRQKVEELGLNNKVKLWGNRNDVDKLVQAMDLFVLPSLFEGLPISALEAQASGLTCVFSDNITKEIDVIQKSIFVSLDTSKKIWAQKILQLKSDKRKEAFEMMTEKGYGKKSLSMYVNSLYLL